MSYFTGSTSHNTTGIKTVTVGFQPIGMRMTVGQKDGATDTTTRYAWGVTDGTNQFSVTTFRDGTGAQTTTTASKLLSVFDRSGGVIAEVVQVTFNSFTATQVKYNVNTANVNYTIIIEAWS